MKYYTVHVMDLLLVMQETLYKKITMITYLEML